MKPELYQKYSTVIVMLWMEKLITDKECRRIMERLNDLYTSEQSKDATTTIDC